jgi:polyisoprenoid-binding protein YceI
MSIEDGTVALGPENGTLTVRTGRHGAAAKAGHNLLIEVGSWSATFSLARDGERPVMELTADARSLRVLEGTGGMNALDDDDKANIAQTIDDEVLKGSAIAFRATSVRGEGERLSVAGDLELAGRTHPLTFELTLAGGRLAGSAVVKQSDWGMKPYSGLFGTLKVNDEVEVGIDVTLPAA